MKIKIPQKISCKDKSKPYNVRKEGYIGEIHKIAIFKPMGLEC